MCHNNSRQKDTIFLKTIKAPNFQLFRRRRGRLLVSVSISWSVVLWGLILLDLLQMLVADKQVEYSWHHCVLDFSIKSLILVNLFLNPKKSKNKIWKKKSKEKNKSEKNKSEKINPEKKVPIKCFILFIF